MSEWQSIETAPRGGKWMLLWWPAVTDCPITGYQSCDFWYAFDGSNWRDLEGPTHWMPLPEPPAEVNIPVLPAPITDKDTPDPGNRTTGTEI